MRGERRQESRDDRKTNRDVDRETTWDDKDKRAYEGRGWHNVDGRPPMDGVVGLERGDKRDKRAVDRERGRASRRVATSGDLQARRRGEALRVAR